MGRPLAPCGTRAAYARHLRNREVPDEACREASRIYERGRPRRLAARLEADVARLESERLRRVPALSPDPLSELVHVLACALGVGRQA